MSVTATSRVATGRHLERFGESLGLDLAVVFLPLSQPVRCWTTPSGEAPPTCCPAAGQQPRNLPHQ